jgi:PAS domain S-box-containing protein
MSKLVRTRQQLLDELQELTSRVMEAEETLRAIRGGEVDALVVSTAEGDQVFTLTGADLPYRVMVETMNEGAITLAFDGTILYCNQRFADIVNGSLEKVIGSSIYQYIPSTDLQLFEALFNRGLKENTKAELALQTGGEDSVPILLSINALQRTDMSGAVCAVMVDITERKKMEETLRISEARYRRLFETAQDGILLLDAETGQISDVNPFLVGMLGYLREDLLGKSLWEICAFKDIQLSKAISLDLKSKGYVRYHELPLETKDGRQIVTEFVGNVYLVNHHKVIQCNIRDITQRKLTEALQISHNELERQVDERTGELIRANEQLLQEIEDRKQAANSLKEALTVIKQLKDQLHEENLYLREEIHLVHSHKEIVGNSAAIRNVLQQMEQVASTDSTVLIQGETGTGKELFAHAIHNLSSRKGRLMIKVNCAALPPTLIESELFGREKGAFTGALSKQSGRFELADGSTIFLDEIDALPLDLQAKLLRVLESGEFERLGSPRTVKVDVRIISATNRDLAKTVSSGSFREDLYYRLNVFQIMVPPLRERREDILPLVWFFVEELSKRMGKRIESIPKKSVEALQAYSWPGNVRELRNVIERAMIITTGPALHIDIPKLAKLEEDQPETLAEVEKRHIIKVLDTTGWRVSGKHGAAEILGIHPKTLESRMQRLGIQRVKKNA